jgi:hypothetical protein
MRINNKITALIACCAILAPVMLAVTETMARTNRAHHRPHYRDRMQSPAGCPVHTNAYGELIDCQGLRKWSGSIGWDNSCFKSLDYLPGQFACDSRGGRH